MTDTNQAHCHALFKLPLPCSFQTVQVVRVIDPKSEEMGDGVYRCGACWLGCAPVVVGAWG